MRTILNAPWSIIGIVLAAICLPRKISFVRGVIACEVLRIWFISPRYCAITLHRIVLYERGDENVLFHELVHTKQYERYWGLFPFLYVSETIRRGYSNNRFEIEAREYGRPA